MRKKEKKEKDSEGGLVRGTNGGRGQRERGDML